MNWLISTEDVHTLRMRVAREAQRHWASVPLRQRARQLERATDYLVAHQAELVDLIGRENGKREVEAIGHEVAASIANVRWLCSRGRKALEPEAVGLPWMPHRRATVMREPWGVALIISPWNFPLSIPLAQAVAGLLAGNAVLLKPSEVTPEIGAAIEEILAPCRLPAGLFGVVQGDGTVGAELIARRPDKVFFTGSLATGRKVMAAAAQHPIPVCVELGGVDAMIVLEDADLDLSSSAAVWGGFFNGGQVCASVERLLVHDSIREAFLQRVVTKTRSLEPATDLGRITAARQHDVYSRHLADARERGLEFHCGGGYVDEQTLEPTVIEADADALVYKEETFGPVIAVRTFRQDAEAVAMHNELWGGLTASVFSGDEARAQSVAHQLRAGLVSVNDVAATLHAMPELPWGGVGSAGFGRSHGLDGLLEFTWSKVIDQPRAGLDFKRPWWFPYDHAQTDVIREYSKLIGADSLAAGARAAARTGRAALRLLFRKPRL